MDMNQTSVAVLCIVLRYICLLASVVSEKVIHLVSSLCPVDHLVSCMMGLAVGQ